MNVKIPPIDLRPIVNLLKKDGAGEISQSLSKEFSLVKSTDIWKEWDMAVNILEVEIVPVLAKGCEVSLLKGPAGRLATCAGKLTLAVNQILTFVPGPIGIVCSIIDAIVCFSTGNILGGVLALLGAIPGFKAASTGVKAAAATGKATVRSSKIATKCGDLLMEMFEKNKALRYIVDNWKSYGKTTENLSSEARRAIERFKVTLRKKNPKADVNLPPGSKVNTDSMIHTYGPREAAPNPLEEVLKQPLPGKSQASGSIFGKADTGGTVIGAQRELGVYRTMPSTYGQLFRPKPFGI